MSEKKRPDEGPQDVPEPERGYVPKGRRRRTAHTTREPAKPVREYTGEERLLLLDTWQRSELTATEFSQLVGVSPQTLASWRRRFEAEGPAGLLGYRKGQKGSRLPEHVRRAILMMKDQHPDWGQDKIHDMLLRTQGLQASAGAVQRVLMEAGYEVVPARTKPNPGKPRRFERARPNQLWQTDLFSFQLKRQRRRVYLVGYMDDCSRFVVGYGLYGSASGANVRETFEAAIANFGAPEEILTDQGAQYHTWRGKSAFSGWTTTSSTVSLQCTDPNAVLGSLPSSVTIPAGELFVRVPLDLGTTPGEATLIVNPGADQWQGTFETRAQAMSFHPNDIVLPLNATALVAARLEVEDEVARSAALGTNDGSVADLESVYASEGNGVNWEIGQRMRVVQLKAVAVGETSVTLSATGLSTASASVEVVPAEIEVSRTSIELSALSGSDGGFIAIVLPEGASFDTLTIPQGASAYLSTTSLGQQKIELVFKDGESRPNSLTIPITLDGDPSGAFSVHVNDRLHPNRYLHYQVEVPASAP